MRLATTALVCTLAAAPVCAQGAVLVVAPTPGPGVHSTTIQPAVDAAANGDFVLVKAGTYPSFSIDAKDVDVIAEFGAVVSVDGFEITNAPSGASVVVRGITSTASEAGTSGALVLDCAGHVHLEACTLVGAVGDGSFTFVNFHPNGAPGLSVDGSTSVALLRCTVRGGDGDDYVPLTALSGEGGDGLFADGSFVAAYECSFLGGDGGDVNDDDAAWTGGFGGDGAEVDAAFLFASGSSFVGGPGGLGGEDFDLFIGYTCGDGGDGGDGIGSALIVSAPVDVHLLDCSTVGGMGGGTLGGGSCGAGATGAATAITSGTVTRHMGSAFEYAARSPVREGASTRFSFAGEPGAFVVLAIASSPFFLFDVGLLGTALVDPGAMLMFPGSLAVNGELVWTPIANLAVAAGTGVELHTQAVYFSPSSLSLVLGPASHVVVLDAAL